MRLDVYIHFVNSAPDNRLDQILENQEKIMATVDELAAAAAAEDTKIDSLIALVKVLKTKLDEALSGVTLPPGVQAKIDEAFAAISDNPDRIQAAIDASTPTP